MVSKPQLKATWIIASLFLVSSATWAQMQSPPLPDADIDFYFLPYGKGLHYRPELPALQQRAGAPEAFWDYFWMFGDGQYSREASPVHYYEKEGDYEVTLVATGNYDTGDTPDKKKKKKQALAFADPMYPRNEEYFAFADKETLIGIEAARDPSPGEENIIVISYRNDNYFPIHGKLHLFFNEKAFPRPHFAYRESYLYHREKEEVELYSCLDCGLLPMDEEQLVALNSIENLPFSLPPLGLSENERDEALNTAEEEYLEHLTWEYRMLKPNEQRNIFVALDATSDMVKDTSVLIHLQVMLEGENGQVFETAVLEIPIVAAHDPNVQQVSDGRVGFRNIESKKLKYKTRFQNTGEGPAETIRIETKFEPQDALSIADLEILEVYPDVPLCRQGELQTVSCLDTAVLNGRLVFTFRNVYLPGTMQDDLQRNADTKGFVRYAIQPGKGIQRRTFKTQASIFFDEEPAVLTNWANTRFKLVEPHYIPMVGYRFSDQNVHPAYRFVGLEIASAYKAHGFFLQPGIHIGLSGRCGGVSRSSTISTIETVEKIKTDGTIALEQDSVWMQDVVKGLPNYTTIEVIPLQIRKYLNDFVGLGMGIAYVFTFEDLEGTGKSELQRFSRLCADQSSTGLCSEPGTWEMVESEQVRGIAVHEKRNFGNFQFFLDLTVGLSRSGPTWGLRAFLHPKKRISGIQLAAYGAWRF